ncbi:RagB/SusD family nutrient uptake outer membrane protein [Zunongwangia sp. F363]|uniref:RagB/SusD family nutrient uptake outer membrane protein n=1 Tax=Autumnicola tepida TaxID=3075595 RepID=A0ABU3C8X3_9FLAO|nr:RagB/SusD family nutrient uptake outer membrane protein [Zunongwangia sp. F363]MDT0642788.1 RagB/SusD family nutrient uptake outer membrane protein [Zunongwangia sp. F363]
MRKFICKVILSFIVMGSVSCDEDFLDEKPIDFLSSSNAYLTYEDFQASINNLYYLTRDEFFSGSEYRPYDYLYGTDIVFDGQPSTRRHTNMVASYDPTSEIPAVHWDNLYKIISESNIIINRSQEAELTDNQKLEIEAEASFFRGFAYRTLLYLYGDVPLITEEVTSPKTDFTRATKEEVLNQIISDLNFSGENLPSINEVADGKVNSLAAYHLLSEVYIAAEEYENAVDAASMVINDPNTALMQERFGARANEQPGDVYWDLFRKHNQNRASGNSESLWVIQFETDVLGGGSVSTSTSGSYRMERQHAPFIRNVRVDGIAPFLWPRSAYTGGRGIGWAVPTEHFSHVVWGDDFETDIRNANHNFVREFTADNPDSPIFGQVLSTENPPEGVDTTRDFYPYQTKVTTPFNHPEGLYADRDLWILTNNAGATYTDQYMFRLAETYLLRAEAYLNLGRTTEAAQDINKVRSRANASPASPGEIDINYILDERLREFGVEEKRRLTLMRLGLLYDRVKEFNPYYADEILPKYNLWPIPQPEIERNIDGNLEQNPGY